MSHYRLPLLESGHSTPSSYWTQVNVTSDRPLQSSTHAAIRQSQRASDCVRVRDPQQARAQASLQTQVCHELLPTGCALFRTWRFYFVCDHGKHRNAKRYKFGCNLILGGERKVTPKTVSFSQKRLTMIFHYTNNAETPTWGLGRAYRTAAAGPQRVGAESAGRIIIIIS